MTMIEAFERVLEILLLPKFDRLKDVDVSKGERFFEPTVKVTFLCTDRIDYQDDYWIKKETNSLFDMMGFEKDLKLNVEYQFEEDSF